MYRGICSTKREIRGQGGGERTNGRIVFLALFDLAHLLGIVKFLRSVVMGGKSRLEQLLLETSAVDGSVILWLDFFDGFEVVVVVGVIQLFVQFGGFVEFVLVSFRFGDQGVREDKVTGSVVDLLLRLNVRVHRASLRLLCRRRRRLFAKRIAVDGRIPCLGLGIRHRIEPMR